MEYSPKCQTKLLNQLTLARTSKHWVELVFMLAISISIKAMPDVYFHLLSLIYNRTLKLKKKVENFVDELVHFIFSNAQ